MRRSTASESGIAGLQECPQLSSSGHRFVAEYMVDGVGNGALNGLPYSRPSPAPAYGRDCQDAEAALRPAGKPDLGQLDRTFTLRASEGFVENFGAGLLSRIAGEAPKVRLHFLHKLDKDSGPLRDGSVDLETGVVDKAIGPEVRAQALFRDRYIT